MNYASIAISILALLVSVLGFWWTHIRSPRRLFWVRVDKTSFSKAIDFALVNGSKNDVLVSEISVALTGEDRSRKFIPDLEVKATADTRVVAAGKIVEFRLVLDEPDAQYFKENGRAEGRWSGAHVFVASVNISWIDYTGETRRAELEHSVIGLHVEKGFRFFGPANERFAKHELYAAA